MPKTDRPNYATRRALHSKKDAEIKARKKLRGVRAEIHEAMLVAAAMKRSKKKGMADREANMEKLGFWRDGNVRDGEGQSVEQKYIKVESA
jgi:hypothetical protein